MLFCDVVGSTALGESVDPEALQGLLASYFERMKAIVESHGGSVEKFIGDAVNVAARLEQAAQPGAVLIGQPTLALVRDAIEFEPVEPLRLKGKAQSVPAYRLRRMRNTPERRHDSRFVGRER